LSRLRLIRILSLALAAVLTATMGYLVLTRPQVTQQIAAVADVGGPFRLASVKGGVVDSKDLAGKPFGVFFGFTHCPEVCPTTMYEMSAALAKLGDEARDFRLFFITVDPERDTADFLKDYLANFDPRIEALVPTPEELAKIARDYRAFYAKVNTSDGGYTMDHTATVYLMDRQGKLASTLYFGEAEEPRLKKLRSLLTKG